MDSFILSARLNSFLAQPELYWKDKHTITTTDLLQRLSKVPGITHAELNYPQHFYKTDTKTIKNALRSFGLKYSGTALRYGKEFQNGSLSNFDPAIRRHAIDMTKRAVETTLEMGGFLTTMWFAYDGFDYTFQTDYEKAWQLMTEGIREIALAYPEAQLSIEYKPYQPRAFSLIGDIGTTLYSIEDIGCKNVGVTLDLCHVMMKRENPACSLALAASHGKLKGIHLNDGYQDNDDGLMIGSVHFMQTLEFIYYLKKYKYNGLVYFDTFPIRENPIKECAMNIKMFCLLSDFIDRYGMDKIEQMVEHGNSLGSQMLLETILK